jgi:hypothetical protein
LNDPQSVYEIFTKAKLKALPVLYAEARRFNVKVPPIVSVKEIMIGDKRAFGLYEFNKRRILINRAKIKEGLELGYEPDAIVGEMITTIIHEFKHYIDHVAYGVGLEKYLQNQLKYEREAYEYTRQIIFKYWKIKL